MLLDGSVTAELAAEGLARDVIRAVQQARKDADLDVSDRIRLAISADAAVLADVTTHAELVKSETLTIELDLVESTDLDNAVSVGDNQLVAVAVAKL